MQFSEFLDLEIIVLYIDKLLFYFNIINKYFINLRGIYIIIYLMIIN